ncbi:MAG: hotdog fold thioesterase [Flavobacteriales bacterium]|jgi:acyl-CoA thioesterase|nr:MAG: hotdog fold thioesterase [Flavobacteriales bacterium]
MKTIHPIVSHMLENDAYSKWLGVEVTESAPGRAEISCVVRPEMTNGFGVAHGGIAYALADSSLAFAANAHGEKAMSIECQMSYLKAIYTNSAIRAVAVEKHRSKRLGRYEVHIFVGDVPVGLFHGTVMFLGEMWAID